jgi:DNA helicase II / ATP-dependent DNA helicase PcrA
VGREYDAAAGGPGAEDTEDEPGVEQFLQQVALFNEQDSLSDDQGIVTLMTMHNAKGLEFHTVFIIGMEDGVFPHLRAIEAGDVEEERRLAYVGMTRARRELYLTHARSRSLFGGRDWNVRSRFIDEVPSELTDLDENALTGTAGASTWSGSAATPTPAPSLGSGATFSLGEDVVHANFGPGVVTGLEPGGLVVVRFQGTADAPPSERKLMADYAPLKKSG